MCPTVCLIPAHGGLPQDRNSGRLYVRHEQACPAAVRQSARCRCTPSYRAKRRDKGWSPTFKVRDQAIEWKASPAARSAVEREGRQRSHVRCSCPRVVGRSRERPRSAGTLAEGVRARRRPARRSQPTRQARQRLTGGLTMSRRINAGPLPGTRRTDVLAPLEVDATIHDRLLRTSLDGADKLPGQGFDDTLYRAGRAAFEDDVGRTRYGG